MLPEVGATELLVIAAIALIVVGPKDLPVLLRRLGKFVAHMRSMANEFRSSFDELARQSELDELRKEVEAMRQAAHEPATLAVNALGADSVMREIGSGLADRLEPEPPLETAPEAADPHAPEAMAPEVRTSSPRAPRAKVSKAAVSKSTAPKARVSKPKTAKAKAPPPAPTEPHS